MGILYKKVCDILIKVVVIFPPINIMSRTVPIIDTDGFIVNDYYTGPTVMTLLIN